MSSCVLCVILVFVYTVKISNPGAVCQLACVRLCVVEMFKACFSNCQSCGISIVRPIIGCFSSRAAQRTSRTCSCLTETMSRRSTNPYFSLFPFCPGSRLLLLWAGFHKWGHVIGIPVPSLSLSPWGCVCRRCGWPSFVQGYRTHLWTPAQEWQSVLLWMFPQQTRHRRTSVSSAACCNNCR